MIADLVNPDNMDSRSLPRGTMVQLHPQGTQHAKNHRLPVRLCGFGNNRGGGIVPRRGGKPLPWHQPGGFLNAHASCQAVSGINVGKTDCKTSCGAPAHCFTETSCASQADCRTQTSSADLRQTDRGTQTSSASQTDCSTDVVDRAQSSPDGSPQTRSRAGTHCGTPLGRKARSTERHRPFRGEGAGQEQ